MTKQDHIRYWLNEAADDWESAQVNFQNARFNWSLFIGHLTLEKVLKALWIKNNSENYPPRLHNLLRLAEGGKYEPTEREKLFLDAVNKFNIEARYPDYKEEFRKRCTKDFAQSYLRQIEEFYQCILKKI
ncbi:MAG: HEPN domain-containing protein [Ignavibacteriae bacterium]|nr:HEPN domain-containing protein [Ignavibacteriota bacterium]